MEGQEEPEKFTKEALVSKLWALRNTKLRMTNPRLHLLCGFLVNPNTFPCFLLDKIGNPHNGAMPTAQEYKPQSVEHSQVRAAPNQV